MVYPRSRADISGRNACLSLRHQLFGQSNSGFASFRFVAIVRVMCSMLCLLASVPKPLFPHVLKLGSSAGRSFPPCSCSVPAQLLAIRSVGRCITSVFAFSADRGHCGVFRARMWSHVERSALVLCGGLACSTVAHQRTARPSLSARHLADRCSDTRSERKKRRGIVVDPKCGFVLSPGAPERRAAEQQEKATGVEEVYGRGGQTWVSQRPTRRKGACQRRS